MLNNLQGARALAAISVVLLHVGASARDHSVNTPLFSSLGNWGNSGVDLFFVISGFIMVYVQDRSPRSPGRFLVDRAVRIVPLYSVMTLALFGLLIVAQSVVRSPAPEMGHLTASFLFLSKAIYGLDPVLYVGWTLEYEALFYLIFALSIVLSKPCSGGQKLLLILSSALILLVLTGLAPPIVLEFLYGAAIARVRHLIGLRTGWLFMVGGGVLLALTIGHDIAIEARWIFWGLPAAIFLMGCTIVPQISNGLVTRLGDASFSLYLTHVFVISALMKVYSLIPVVIEGDVWAAVVCGVAILVGILVHRYFEQPLTQLVRRGVTWIDSLNRRTAVV
ncbi:acyltransferase family protein [Sphingomonas edaphi]|uniref:Acyltransferase n=1 Tax=Sphingomonas edaphi TaxID=2315689 RepID=A0A418PYA6_9SPHN|nr:acyltransferase [Sphingomonas edaphi]RIX27023.1 acyltransferase [Sphingomonas edaphi]